ncbi:DUF4244 domain-containing protein [Nocardioides sp.]|uniref:DUF4244 domain-containing protein n=1 Tax=Nocardioides sp. TaxID=35761 RepID=UPI003563AC14
MSMTTTRSLRRASRRAEAGITTAEYAVGTAAGCGFAGLLYKFLTGDVGQTLLKTIFDTVISGFGWG